MSTNEKKPMEFTFDEIPLKDAEILVTVGSGMYSDLKGEIMARLKNIEPDKAIAFGLPKGELAKRERRGLCFALNSMFRKSKTNWGVTYNGSRQRFICLPRDPKHSQPLAKSSQKTSGQRSETVERLNQSAKKLWPFTWSPTHRRAISIFGVERLALSSSDLATIIDRTPSGVTWTLGQSRNQECLDAVESLTKAYGDIPKTALSHRRPGAPRKILPAHIKMMTRLRDEEKMTTRNIAKKFGFSKTGVARALKRTEE